MGPRVVVTGIGVVSPLGIGKNDFCRGVMSGQSGIKRISRFDPSSLPVHIAGEITDFDELAWVDKHERKHFSRAVPLCIAASTEALTDAGLDPQNMSLDEKREIGIVLGSGGGTHEFSEEQYRLWHAGNVKQVSLFCIPSGTMGSLSSEVQMRFGFRGYSHVITTSCTSSTDAIGYAMQHIQAGVQPMFLVGGVDSPITPGTIKGYTMPGSRVKEVRMNLPTILEAVKRLGPSCEYLLPVAPTLDREILQQQIGKVRVTLVPESLPALWHSRAGIIASGTATVEAAMMATPFAMVYRVSPLTYLLGKPRIKVPYFAMVNLIAGEEVVPELVQQEFTAENIVSKINELLPDGEVRDRQLEGLAKVKASLRSPVASDGRHPADRAADIILELRAG